VRKKRKRDSKETEKCVTVEFLSQQQEGTNFGGVNEKVTRREGRAVMRERDEGNEKRSLERIQKRNLKEEKEAGRKE